MKRFILIINQKDKLDTVQIVEEKYLGMQELVIIVVRSFGNSARCSLWNECYARLIFKWYYYVNGEE